MSTRTRAASRRTRWRPPTPPAPTIRISGWTVAPGRNCPTTAMPLRTRHVATDPHRRDRTGPVAAAGRLRGPGADPLRLYLRRVDGDPAVPAAALRRLLM